MPQDDTIALSARRTVGPSATRIGVKWVTLEAGAMHVNFAIYDDVGPDRVEVGALATVDLGGPGIAAFFQSVAASQAGAAGATAGEKLRNAFIGTLNALGRQRFDT